MTIPTQSGIPTSVAPIFPGAIMTRSELMRRALAVPNTRSYDLPPLPEGQRMGGQECWPTEIAQAWLDTLPAWVAASDEREAQRRKEAQEDFEQRAHERKVREDTMERWREETRQSIRDSESKQRALDEARAAARRTP